MLKNLLVSNILITVMASPFAFADSFTSNKTGGKLKSIITMTVNTPTCVIQPDNNIDFKRITMAELLDGKRHETARISFECETTPAGISLVVSPTGGNNVVSGQPGVIESTLTGAGFKLDWGEESSVGKKGQPVEYNTPLTLPAARISNINLVITPVAITGINVTSGTSKSQVNLKITYS